MAGVPKHRISKSKRLQRRGPKKLELPKLVRCENCGALKEPHVVCPECGYYKGKEVK